MLFKGMKTIAQISSLVLISTLFVSVYAPDALAKKKRKKRKKRPDICKVLDAAPVKALLGTHTEVVSTRGACAYMAKFADAEARNKACAELAMNAVGSGQKFKASDCAPTENRIDAYEQRQYDTVAKAQQAFKSFRENNEKGVTVRLTGSRDKGFKSKVKIGGKKVSDAKSDQALKEAQEQVKVKLPNNDEVDQTRTFQSATETVKIKNVDEAFYIVNGKQLMLRKGKRILSIIVKIEGKDERARLEVAKTLAQAWLK